MSTINLEDRDAYVAECCALILAQKSVQEVVVMDENDDPISSTLSSRQESLDYTGLFGSLLFKARRAVRLINQKDQLLEVRIKTKKHEAILTPDDHVVFITIQKPVDNYESV